MFLELLPCSTIAVTATAKTAQAETGRHGFDFVDKCPGLPPGGVLVHVTCQDGNLLGANILSVSECRGTSRFEVDFYDRCITDRGEDI